MKRRLMKELTISEISMVDGAGPLGDAALALGAASVIGGGLACIPTPATPALAGFAVITGVLSVALSFADSRMQR
jgi:hypothetical protein